MKAKLINAIRDLARKICNVNIVVKKLKISHASNGIKDNNHQVNIEQSVNNMDNNMQTDENLQKLDDMHQISEYDYSIKINKEKINLSYYDTLNPSVFPWYMLKGFSNLSPYDLYKIYSTELVTDESNYSKLILKKNFTAKKKKLSKKKKLRGIAAISIKSAVNNVVQPEETPSDEIFCYCKKPCMGEYMIGKCYIL